LPARDKLNLPSALVNLALAGSLYASWKSKYADCAAIGGRMARLFLERAKRDGFIRRAYQLNEIQSNRQASSRRSSGYSAVNFFDRHVIRGDCKLIYLNLNK
jgi:hypothetical protein